MIFRCFALVLCAAALTTASAADPVPSSPPSAEVPSIERVLLPPVLQDRLGLEAGQRERLAQLVREFSAQHRDAVGSLPEDLGSAMQAIQQAREKRDRSAFQQGLEQVRRLMPALLKLRAEFEPSLLAALTDDQRQKYNGLKPELQHPAVLFGMAAPTMRPGNGPGAASPLPFRPARQVDLSKLKPLTEMGDNEYNGCKGGLYPEGKNERPPAHEAAGRILAAKIRALDSEGKLSPQGKIGLLTIGMSNTQQATEGFRQAAQGDPDMNPQVVIVNGAQGGQTAARTQDPDDHASGAAYWAGVDARLRNANLTRAQVQAVWLKQADAAPTTGFPEYAKTLENEIARIIQVLHQRFPNLRLVYLSSRTYGGFAKSPLNPEPYAYESGFSIKWLIERQIKGDPTLNFDPAKGTVTAPWLSWGPYLWANGANRRADGFYYEPADFRDADGTHPSRAGQLKVGKQLLQFFKTDTTTKGWFVKSEK